jgi:hypothetical protein
MPHRDPQRRAEYQKAYRVKNRARKVAVRQAWDRANPEKVRGYQKAANARARANVRASRELKKQRLLYSAKQRARQNGFAFSIRVEDLLWPEICPVLGIRLDHGGCGRASPASASLDRVDNGRG